MIDRTSFPPFVFVAHDDPPVRNCGGRSRHRYNLFLHGPDMAPTGAAFGAVGIDGDGRGWESLARALAGWEVPDVAGRLNFDSEPEMLIVTSNDAEALRWLGRRLSVAHADPDLSALVRATLTDPAGPRVQLRKRL